MVLVFLIAVKWFGFGSVSFQTVTFEPVPTLNQPSNQTEQFDRNIYISSCGAFFRTMANTSYKYGYLQQQNGGKLSYLATKKFQSNKIVLTSMRHYFICRCGSSRNFAALPAAYERLRSSQEEHLALVFPITSRTTSQAGVRRSTFSV